jgi:hypothetical protein
MSTPDQPRFEQAEFLLRPERTRTARAAPAREENLRRVRRVSNWSLAALLIGVGTTSAALAHVLPGQTSPVGHYASTQTGGLAQPTATSGHAPVVSGPVAVSSGSQVVPGSSVTSTGQGSTTQTGTVTAGSTWKDS